MLSDVLYVDGGKWLEHACQDAMCLSWCPRTFRPGRLEIYRRGVMRHRFPPCILLDRAARVRDPACLAEIRYLVRPAVRWYEGMICAPWRAPCVHHRHLLPALTVGVGGSVDPDNVSVTVGPVSSCGAWRYLLGGCGCG